jgi:hypothetical protein
MRRTLFFALLVGLAGCSEPKPTVRLQDALPTLLIPPSSSVISRENGEDAIVIHFRSDLDQATMSRYYRGMLSKAPWKIVRDSPDGDGGTLLAERPDGPPLWVTIRKPEGGASGSLVDLAGAKVSTGPKTQ